MVPRVRPSRHAVPWRKQKTAESNGKMFVGVKIVVFSPFIIMNVSITGKRQYSRLFLPVKSTR